LCILFMCITMFSISKAMSALPVGFAYSTYSGLTVTWCSFCLRCLNIIKYQIFMELLELF
jgi:multidrug transporter EmrE-like cation transporter